MKKFLLALFVFSFVSCTVAVPGPWSPKGLVASAPVKILGMSGWTDNTGGLLYSQLGDKVKAKYGDKVQWQMAAWYEWPKFEKTPYDIDIGWSLGGDSIIRLVNSLKAHGLPLPKMLITIAPRYQTDVKSASSWDWFLISDSAQTFAAPIPNTHNFWTHGPLPSAPMTGAAENVNVFPYWHGNAPEAAGVMKAIDDFMAGK